jgi:hypothetical protein
MMKAKAHLTHVVRLIPAVLAFIYSSRPFGYKEESFFCLPLLLETALGK